MASTVSASSLLNTRAPVASKRSSSRSNGAVRVFAQAKKEQLQAPRDAVLKTFGAIAAAQLALSGAALADIIPDSAKSSSARDALNEKTSNLPSFGDVGRALNKQFGSNDPKEVGRQIDSVTPDAPDLTKNPKEIGNDLKRGAQKIVGDLSLANDKDIGQAGKNLGRDVKNAAKNLGNDIGSKLPGQDVGDKLAGKAKNLANSADKKAKNLAGDLSLANDKDIGQAGKDLGRDAKNAAKNLGNDIGSKLPGQDIGDKLAGKAKNLANTADKKAKNMAGDLSDLPELPNPFKGSADPENVAKDAKNKAKSLGSDISKSLPNSSDLPNLGDAKRAVGDAKRAVESNIPSSPGNLNIPKNS